MLGSFLRVVVFIGVRLVGAFCFLKSSIYYFKKPKRCPPIKDEILLIPARSLAEKIRKREIASESVIRAYISRIKMVNPILNAVVEDRFDLALQEAKNVDEMIFKSKLSEKELEQNYPLLGLPLTVKESIAVKGLSHCAGRLFAERKRASEDANVIKLCKEAGAIPLLVSNTPELCINFESYNKVTGTTCNPYDTRRTPGGSSGGEAALLGAGASLIGIGSDICGSIRLPAHFCCIWGHKPSPYTVSVDGHYPSCKHQDVWNEIFNLGPMTRYATDLLFLMDVILEKKFHGLFQLNQPVPIQNIKFYYMENDSGSLLTHSIDRDILAAIKKLITSLKIHYACEVQKVNVKKFKHSPELCYTKLSTIDDIDSLFDSNGNGSFAELFRYLTCRSHSNFIPILYGIIRRIFQRLPNSVAINCNKSLASLKRDLTELLGENGVLLYPCHGEAANFHGQIFGKVFDYAYTGIFNCIGFPVTNCPLGLNSQGLPIGIQVVASTNNDKLTLTVAQEIERIFGGWIPPSFSEDNIQDWQYRSHVQNP